MTSTRDPMNGLEPSAVEPSAAEPSAVEAASCDVAVVGAGIAGLTAADALTRAGATVRVLEARDRVGGRLNSTMTEGFAVDLGATWFWPDEPAVRSVSRELGLTIFPQHTQGDALFETVPPGGHRLDGNPVDVPAYRVVSGMESLATRLADRLAAGTLRLGDAVTSVTLGPDGVRVGSRRSVLRADQVVIALPPALAVATIGFTPALPSPLRSRAETTAVWMGSTVKAVAIYDHPFWREEGLSGSAISYAGPFRELHDHSDAEGRRGAIFGFAPAGAFARTDATPARIRAAYLGQLIRLFGPAATHPVALHVTDWSRESFTMPAVPHPGASTSGFGAAEFQEPVAGRLHFASTETATEYAGHIEGAIRSGTVVARRVLDRLHD